MTGVGRVPARWWLAAAVAVALSAALGLAIGAVDVAPAAIARDAVAAVTGGDRALSAAERAIVWELRLPRVALGLLVGATLAIAGAAYQGIFRNPLADPYLLGAAAGGGLGVTIAIVAAGAPAAAPAYLPAAAFAGCLAAVAVTYAVGVAGARSAGPTALILGGVAVASFLTAAQTYLQQRHQDVIRQVYSWILGRLTTAGWGEVRIALPYAAVAVAVLIAHRRVLDVMAVGDDEAASLGVDPARTRLVVIAAASLGTAAAVSVSGLIGFVGIIVPHTVRLLAGSSYRAVLPLSMAFGAAFVVAADLVARSSMAPAEIPIGVVTAFLGAPFFIVVLRSSRRLAGP